MQAFVNLAPDTQTVFGKDTASINYGTMDGTTFCGPRTYTISPTSNSFFSLTTEILTLQSTNPTEITTGPITITITATLDNYPLIPAASSTFTIEILDYCTNTVLSFSTTV